MEVISWGDGSISVYPAFWILVILSLPYFVMLGSAWKSVFKKD